MTASKPVNPWAVIIVILALVIAGGVIAVICRYDSPLPLELTLEEPPEVTGEIYISGNVTGPGIYPLREGDTVNELLRVAGGAGADRLELTVGAADATPQRIDINRADVWLLEALPGIGETKAVAIVAYRESHGQFRSVDELTKVTGIGPATVDSIRNMITVGE